MTSRFEDSHTRAGVLRGGSWFHPANRSLPLYDQTSFWYFPHAHQLDKHSKLLLQDDAYDRAGTVGFRCVRELAEPECSDVACIQVNPPAARPNLTTEGTADWAHWGSNKTMPMAADTLSGTSLISDVEVTYAAAASAHDAGY
eukprot:UC1_evm1s1359